MKKGKSALKGVLLLLMLSLTLSALSGCTDFFVDKGDVWYDSVSINAEIQSNGDLNVSETWVAEFSGEESYRNLYKVINLKDGNFISSIENLAVRDNDYNKDYTRANLSNLDEYLPSSAKEVYYIDSLSSEETEIGLVMPEEGVGKRSFTLTYTITDFAAGYSDGTVVYFKPYSDQNEMYIENFTMTVKLPDSAATDNSLAWFHCTANDSLLTVNPNSFTYSATDIAGGTQIETRIISENSLYAGLTKTAATPIKDTIAAEERQWADDYAKELKRKQFFAVLDVILAVLIAIGAVVFVVLYRYFNRRIKGNYPKYIREIPEGWTAAEMGYLFYYYEKGGAMGNKQSRLLSATVLELARKYYIEIIPDEKKDYRISVIDVPSLKLADLKPHELTIYNMLNDVFTDFGKPFSMDDFEAYAKKKYIAVNQYVDDFKKRAKDKFSSSNYIDKLKIKNSFLGVVIGMFVLGALMFMTNLLPTAGIITFLSAIGLVLFSPKIPRLNADGEKEYMESQGLKNYMLDFSNLKEYDIPKLVLWEEYLVFATMMGISKEVVKSLKLVYPEIREMDNRGYGYLPVRSYFWTYLWLSNTRNFVGGGSFDIGSRINTVFTNVTTTARALAQPKSSGGIGGIGGIGKGGGGFRGGGGGFGGGRGGAR